MADGNVGNLWMSLGLKETVSKELKNLGYSLNGTDDKVKELQKALKGIGNDLKSGDVDAYAKGIANLSKFLKDAKIEAKGLSTLLGSISGANVQNLLGGEINATNAKKYLGIIKEITSALSSLGRGNSENTFGLLSGLYRYSVLLDDIVNIKGQIKDLKETLETPAGKKHEQSIKDLIAEYTKLRTEMIGVVNSGNLKQLDSNKYSELLGRGIQLYEALHATAVQAEKGVTALSNAADKEATSTQKSTEAVNEQTNAIKKQEEQLKATTAAQKEKSAAESKTATAPKIQPFVEDKGLDKMLNDVTAAREKDAAATQTQIAYTKILNEVLDAFKGKASTLLGVKDDSGRKYVDILNEANAAIEKMNKARAAAMAREGKDFKPENYPDPIPRIKKALEYLSLLQRIDIAQKHISEVKAANPNVGTKNIKEAAKLVENFRDKLLALQNDKYLTGADDAHILGAYRKTLAMTLKDVDAIIGKLQKPNPLSDLDGNFSKLDVRIDAVREKLAKLRDLMNEGTQKGYTTSMFGERISGLGGIVTRMEAAMSNKNGELANVDKMKQLFSDISVELNKASTAMQTYGREKAKAVATDRNLETMEARYRRLQELISEVNRKIRELNDSVRQGFKVGADTSRAESAISRLTEMRDKFNNADIGSKNAVAELVSEYKILKNEIGNAKSEQDKLNNAITRANKKQDRKNERQEARDNKQRLSEIKATEARYDSLGNKVRALRREFSRGISLGADVSKAEAEIHRLIDIMRYLMTLRGELMSGDEKALGRLGNIGAGHDTTLAGRALQDQRAINAAQEKTNREKEKSINLERAHQQEIAQSAAKARNDLAAAFARANAEAKKMQSIVGDIKSLFLQGGIVFGAQQFFNSIVQTGGEIVQQHVALRSILGDVQKADELFAQTQQLALQSPFKFGELNRDVKQLAAFGVEANDLYDTTKRLADIASGLGVSFERLGLAYGQVKARSWLDGKELRQFAYAGLPLLQRITELYNSEGKNGRNNYTQADVKKMITARQVSFEDVQKVLWKMTDEGGQFYNMQFVLSETLLGRWNKLIDAWDIMLGKFAEGKNVVGGTFSFLINRTTDLVLALDKVSNAALAFGAMYALRKGATAIASRVGISSNLAALRAEQQVKLRTFAVEQQQALIEGKITQEKMRQNIADYQGMLNSKINTRNAVEQAALEGRLSALKMQKAFREGLISEEMIEQLRLMGMISAKEAELITKEGTRARMSLAVNQAKGKLEGFFSGWNIATLGITIGTALYSAYSQFKDSIKQDTDRINETAKTTVKTLSDTLSEVGNKGTGETLQQQVDKMTDVLKQSGLYTDSIKEQIDSTNDLGKEYDILKQKIIDARNENKFTPSEGENFAKAKKASGAGFAGGASWFGQWTGIGQDDIDENINDVAGNLAQLQMKMEKFGDSTKSSMEKVANSILGARAAGMTFEEKIAEICSSRGVNGFWETFVKKVSNGNKDVEDDLRGLEDDLDDFSGNFGQIATDDIPKYLEYMAKSRNMDMVEFSRWCKQHPDKFRTMLDQMLSEANKKVPGLVARLRSVAMAILNIGKAKPQEGNTGPKVWKNPNKVGTIERKVFDKLQKAGKLKGGTDGFWQKEMAEYLHNLNGGNSNGWTSFGEAVRKRYKEVRDENDNAKNAGDRQPYVREQRMLETIAAQSGISLDVGKNKVTGHFGKGKNKNGREEDTELKRLQERLSSLKSARQMYQKYKSMMSDEEAKKKTYNLFPEVSGLNLDDYQTAVHSLLEGFSINTTERKKFQTSIYREVAEWLFNEKDKKEYEKTAADFTELLNRLSSQWDLYKELLSKTGDKNFSSTAFNNPGYIDDKAKELIVEYNNKFGKDFQRENAMSMSDGVAKETLKGPGEYEAWKKIVDLLRNNYIKILQDAADIIEKTEDYEDKILKIRERYNELISKTNDPGIKARYEIQRDKEVGQVKLDQFKNSSDYLNFYGAIVSLGIDKANAIGTEIRKNINDALQKGAIDAREYAKEIKQLEEQLSKLTKPRPSFLNGGLDGIVNAKKERANEQITLGSSKYNEAKRKYDEAKINGNSLGMALAEQDMEAAKAMMKGGEELLSGALEMETSISTVSMIIHGINDTVQGLNDSFQDIKDTASALGVDTESNSWTDANAFFSGFASSSASATKAFDSFKSGNIGGAISGAVGSVTGWIKSYAAAHDANLDRQIKLAERQITELQNLRTGIKSAIENTLGGVYAYKQDKDTTSKLRSILGTTKAKYPWQQYIIDKNSRKYGKDTKESAKKALEEPDNAYESQRALLLAQRDEMQKQLTSEQRKKKKDDDKIADLKQQLVEMNTNIENLAKDYLKEVYGVDLKSWASQLTDAVVGAWEKGEDAIDAYKNKAKQLIKDLAKNIVSQKLMEKALQPTLDMLTSLIENSKDGRLNEFDVTKVADKMIEGTQNTIYNITAIFDKLREMGYDFSELGTGSVTNSIQNITEETADILASYLNAVRLDVSVNREQVRQMLETMNNNLPKMGHIQEAQLGQLKQLVILSTARNEKLDSMLDWMSAVTTSGRKKINIS